MSSFTTSDELSLAVLNAQVNGSSILNFVTAMDAIRNRTDEINICGTPCPGTCGTCVQSNADLAAFYAVDVPAEPIEVVVMASAADETQAEWEEQELAARARDEIEAAVRSGEAFDYDAADNRDDDEDDEDEHRGCQCLDCLNADDQNWIPSYDDRYDDDGDCGLDWNESGYFD